MKSAESAPLRSGYCPDLQTRSIHLHQRTQQNIRAILNILWSREFFRRVTDAAHAGNEDHADGREAGHVLCIVTGVKRFILILPIEYVPGCFA